MNRFRLLRERPLYALGTFYLCAAPALAYAGNAVTDIWISTIAAAGLIIPGVVRQHRWPHWLRVAMIFWGWIIAVSLLSDWPRHALGQGAPWIRFPLFAFAFALFLHADPLRQKWLRRSLVTGTLLLMLQLLVERITHPEFPRLFGPAALNLKPGWYLIGFGMPAALLALEQMRHHVRAWRWAIPFTAALVLSVFSTGEVYSTIEILFALGLYGLFSRFWNWRLLGGLAVLSIAALVLINALPTVGKRFTVDGATRLPWRTTSDYYPPWRSAVLIGNDHPWMGIGINNYMKYCETIPPTQRLAEYGIGECLHHPHQMYLETYASAGFPAVLIFSAVVLLMLAAAARPATGHRLSPIALALAIATFWPIATYSQTFGQHRNFFTWMALAVGLAQLPAAAYPKRRLQATPTNPPAAP